MARDFFSAIASSAAVERVFSIAKGVVTDCRNRITPQTLQEVVLLRFWGNVSTDVVDEEDDFDKDDSHNDV